MPEEKKKMNVLFTKKCVKCGCYNFEINFCHKCGGNKFQNETVIEGEKEWTSVVEAWEREHRCLYERR